MLIDLLSYSIYGSIMSGLDYQFYKVVPYNSVSTANQAILVDIPIQ